MIKVIKYNTSCIKLLVMFKEQGWAPVGLNF